MDNIIIIFYLILVLFIGISAGRRTKSIRDYILANRRYTTPVLLATIVATSIGAGHTIGSVSRIYSSGILYALTGVATSIQILWISQYVVPHLYKLEGKLTIAEIMGDYYGNAARRITGIVGVLFSIGVIAAQILALKGLVSALYPLQNSDLYTLIIGAVVVAYSFFGGIRGVATTDVLQFGLFILILPLITSLIMEKAGGVVAVFKTSVTAYTYTFNDILMYSFLFLLIPDFCPSFVQRLLMIKKPWKLKPVLYGTAFLEFAMVIITIIIGVSVFILYKGINPDSAFVYVINDILPLGVKGLGVVALLAIIMSTIDSDLNTGGILTVHDIFQVSNKSEVKKIRYTKYTTLIIGFGAIFIALRTHDIIGIILYSCGLYLPLVSFPFLFAIFGKKVSKQAFLFNAIVSILVLCTIEFTCDEKWSYFGFVLSFLSGLVAFLIANTYYLSKAKKVY